MIRFIVLTCSFLAFVKGQSTAIRQCTMKDGFLPDHTYVVGCTTPPCELPQLQDAVINITFRALHNITKMRTLATAYFFTIPIPFDLQENAETCNFLQNTNCPLQLWQEVQYTLRFYIEPYIPAGTSFTFEFSVVDDNNEPVFCIRVPTIITAPVEGNTLLNNSTLITDV